MTFSMSKLGSSGLKTTSAWGLEEQKKKARTVRLENGLLSLLEGCVFLLGLLDQVLLVLHRLLLDLLIVLRLQGPAVHNTVTDTSYKSRVTDDLKS